MRIIAKGNSRFWASIGSFVVGCVLSSTAQARLVGAPVTDINQNIRGDGHGTAWINVYRPSNRTFYLLDSWYGTTTAVPFGQSGDIPVPGNYFNYEFENPGFREAEIAVFRPSNGHWYIENSAIGWGQNGDIPAPGDFDGDGDLDPTVFRGGAWYIREFGNFGFGQNGDIPVHADWDGDGSDDIAVYRPSNYTWYRWSVSEALDLGSVAFGQPGDIPVPADYDNDGAADVAVFRPSNSTWYFRYADGWQDEISFGQAGDIPIPGDYGVGFGDAAAPAVYRPSNRRFYVWPVGYIGTFGSFGDMPLP